MDELLTIGAFARLARLSPKALRLYDELGLLQPAAVDSDTGYRYYRPGQAQRARLIGALRRLGLPLADIGELVDAPPAVAAAALEAYRAQLAAQTAQRDRLAAFLVEHLTGKGADVTTGMRYASRTETGLVRETNEDAAFAGPDVLAVADGMRGPVGQAASAAAITAVQAWKADGDLLGSVAALVGSVEQAVRDVDAGGDAVTTLTALLRGGGDRLAILHIGDTRAGVLRRGAFTRLTIDHTYVQSLVDAGSLSPEEAATHPQRALLTRALTGRGGAEPDVSTHDMIAGDRFLLASDGLTVTVPEAQLRDILAAAPGPEDAVAALVEAAYRAGAPDNVACVVADVVEL